MLPACCTNPEQDSRDRARCLCASVSRDVRVDLGQRPTSSPRHRARSRWPMPRAPPDFLAAAGPRATCRSCSSLCPVRRLEHLPTVAGARAARCGDRISAQPGDVSGFAFRATWGLDRPAEIAEPDLASSVVRPNANRQPVLGLLARYLHRHTRPAHRGWAACRRAARRRRGM